MGAAGGGLAIRQGAPNTGAIIDAVGWGTATNTFFEGTRDLGAGGQQQPDRVWTERLPGHRQQCRRFRLERARRHRVTLDHADTPAAAVGRRFLRRSSASPTAVAPGGNTLLTVTVIPATTPPSTGITVVGNLSDIGGSADAAVLRRRHQRRRDGRRQCLFISGDRAGKLAGGTRNVTAVASDAQARTVISIRVITINAPLPNEDPLILGNPSNATPDIANENNYLMPKPQYTLSYNRSQGDAELGRMAARQHVGSAARSGRTIIGPTLRCRPAGIR